MVEKHEFAIGEVFFTAAGKWLCTDIGARTVVAVKYDDLVASGDQGPPYSVVETVFGEYDLEGCSKEPWE